MTRQLYVIAKTRPELYERLHRYFLGRETVAVVLDRRGGVPPSADESGRRRHDVSGELRTRGWATIDLTRRAGLLTPDEPAADTPSLAVILEGSTPAARAVLGGVILILTQLPFSIERGSEADNRRLLSRSRLLLPDHEPFRVSRRHCTLLNDQGRLWVVDINSRLGTTVNGTIIGGRTGRVRAELRPGHNELAIGGPRTPYRFQVTLEHQAAAPLPSQRPAAAESAFPEPRHAATAATAR
jgi:hypothetical protein